MTEKREEKWMAADEKKETASGGWGEREDVGE
jgi:hypothetical protein